MIPFKSKQLIIEHLVKKEILAGGGKIWAREMALMRKLGDNKYDAADFWLDLNPGYSLNSLAWFIGEGGVELEQAWRMYQFEKSQKKVLDDSIKSSTMEHIKNPEPVLLEKKITLIDWADSM